MAHKFHPGTSDKRSMGVRLILLALALTFAASAAEVQNLSEDRLVLISGQPEGQPWQVEESACVFRNTQRIACGYVETSNETAGRIVLTSSSGVGVQVGDRVERVEFTSNVFRILPGQNSIFVTHEANRHWEVGDTACLAREDKLYGCGLMVGSDDSNAEIQLYESQAPVPQVGDEVRRIGGKVSVISGAEDRAMAEQLKSGSWKVGQPVAFFREGRGIGTGRITASNPQNAEVRISAYVEIAGPGDTVLPVSSLAEEPPSQQSPPNVAAAVPEPSRQAASAGPAAEPPPARSTAVKALKKPPQPPGSTLISFGMVSVVSSLRFLRFERRFEDRYRLGSLNYLVGGSVTDGDLKGFGSFVTGSYQPFDGAIRGVFLQLGAGVMSMEVAGGLKERLVAFAGSAHIGSRWTWSSGFSVALSGGTVMIFGKSTPRIPTSLPSVMAELGVHF